MMSFPHCRWTKIFLQVLFFTGTINIASPANAAMPVIDNSNLAQNALTAAKAAEQLIKMTNLETLQTSTLDSLGLTGAFEAAGDLGGVLSDTTSDTLNIYNDVRSDVSSISRLASQIEGLAGAARSLDSPTSAVRFIRATIGMTERATETGAAVFANYSPAEQGALISARASFAQESTSDAIGIAMYQRESLDASVKAASELRSAASNAETLREQMAVNTAAVIGVMEQIQMLRALMAAQIQAQNAGYLANHMPSGYLGIGEGGQLSPPPQQQSSQGVFQ